MTGRVRKRVTQACEPCGVKKIKCDGVYPECGPCCSKDICTYGATKRKVNRTSSQTCVSVASPGDAGATLARTQFVSANQSPLNFHGPRNVLSVSTRCSVHLFQTYFNSIHPLWPLLYKPMYSSLDYASLLPPVLVSAMFAIASCVQKTTHGYVVAAKEFCPEPRHFFEETLLLLQEDDDKGPPHPLHALKPSITSCQVLLILALQQHGVAEYARGAVLISLASGMAIELRLHRADKSHNAVEREVRSRLWWNLFIAEKMMSVEMGRPVILRSEETDAPYPSVTEIDEFELMPARRDTSQANSDNAGIKLRTLSVLHSSIELATIMEQVSREIYGLSARNAIREDQAAGELPRLKIWKRMREWERNIEDSPLKLDLNNPSSNLPGTLTNHIIMLAGTIILHRPFIDRWHSNPASATSDPASAPLQICMQAAKNICIVLERHTDCLAGLPCDTIFSIFTAASTLLYNLNQNTSNDDTKRQFKLCISWLKILGRSWKSGEARQQLLAELLDLPKECDSFPGLPFQSQTTDHPSLPLNNQITSATASSGVTLGTSDESNFQPPDWAFLRDFGDSFDDFYVLDEQLRELLDGS